MQDVARSNDYNVFLCNTDESPEEELQVLHSLAARANPEDHPLLNERDDRRVAVVVVSSDKGLCGSFNAGVADLLVLDDGVVIACGIFSAMFDTFKFVLTHHFDGYINQIAHDRLNISTNITNFGEFSRFDLNKRRPGQFCQPPRDFRLTDAGGPDHENIFRRNFISQFRLDLCASPSVTQRNCDSSLRGTLADDMLI